MTRTRTDIEYLLLFVPYVLAELTAFDAVVSYLVAWSGSFLILYLTLSGRIKPLPKDRSLSRQILRPIVLTQCVFAGYTAISSIFYFMDLSGYYFLSYSGLAALPEQFALAAAAQRYYVLAHAAFSTGVLLAMDYRQSGQWRINMRMSLPSFMLGVAAVSLVATQVVQVIPYMSQLYGRIAILSLVASVISLALSLPRGRYGLLLLNLGVYLVNLLQALLSGWKEEVVVMILLLAAFAYPHYKRSVVTFTPVVLAVLVAVLPAYAGIFRSLNWYGEYEATEAAQQAYQQISRGEVNLERTNWQFMTGRLSEIGLFTQYIDHTPDQRSFYGTAIAEQAALGIIPRLLWPGKPSLEALSMERTYENGIATRQSNISAKPQFAVDGYLSAGAFGVLVACLIYGLLASLASRLAEKWFGGYLIGSGLVFTSLFQIMWTGNSFEFFFPTVFWSFVLMAALFYGGKVTGLIVPAAARQDRPRANRRQPA